MWGGRGVTVILVLFLLSSTSLVSTSVGADEPGIPSEPLNLQAVPGNAQVLLSWDPPADNGSAINEYWVYRGSPSPLELWTTLGNVTSFLDVGLTNGIVYNYTVRAVNQAGLGNMSQAVLVTPRTVPSAPLNPVAIPGNLYLNLTWDEPNYDGGAEILSYSIYDATTETMIGQSGMEYFIHSLLEPLISHQYIVTAFNEAGEGVPSITFAGIPDIPPGVPMNLSVSAGVNNVTLSWDPSVDNGGSGPIGYRIYRGETSDNLTLLLALDADVTSYTDYGLAENHTYCYLLSAFNLVGESETSVPIWANVSGNAEVFITTIMEGDEQVGLFWDLTDQSIQVLRYWLYRGPSEDNVSLLRTDITEKGCWDLDLVNGQQYYYRVAAQTPAGLGWSQNVSAIPHRTPNEPVNLTAEGHLGYIYLTWDPPLDDGGANVTGYKVYMGQDGSDPKYLAEVNGTTFLCAALDVGTIYSFQVSAVNRAGEGNLSLEVQKMCGDVPSAPLALTAMSGQNYVSVTWEPPSYSGFGPIITYEVRRYFDETVSSITSTGNTYNDTTVSNRVTYYYQVRAINQVGEGAWSEIVEGHPDWDGDAPSKVMNLIATSGEDFILLTWDTPENGGQMITKYFLYRGISPELMVYMTDVTGNLYNDTDLPTDITYYYKAVAINVVGQGPDSDTVNATTAIVPVEKKVDVWATLFTGAIPMATLVLLAAIGALFLIRKKFVNRRGKGPGPKGRSGTTPRKPGSTNAQRPGTPKNGRSNGKGPDGKRGRKE